MQDILLQEFCLPPVKVSGAALKFCTIAYVLFTVAPDHIFIICYIITECVNCILAVKAKLSALAVT